MLRVPGKVLEAFCEVFCGFESLRSFSCAMHYGDDSAQNQHSDKRQHAKDSCFRYPHRWRGRRELALLGGLRRRAIIARVSRGILDSGCRRNRRGRTRADFCAAFCAEFRFRSERRAAFRTKSPCFCRITRRLTPRPALRTERIALGKCCAALFTAIRHYRLRRPRSEKNARSFRRSAARARHTSAGAFTS